MNVIDFHFVGPPCGQHGPYTFYKAFAYNKSGKYKILSLGEFFFLKISSHELCIGELQLLWEDRNNRLSLSSSRLYFLPEDTLDDGHTERGEDEVLAMSEKAVVRLEDLIEWITPDVRWTRGLEGIWEPPPSPTCKNGDAQPLENGLTTTNGNNKNNIHHHLHHNNNSSVNIDMDNINNNVNVSSKSSNMYVHGNTVKYIHPPCNGQLANGSESRHVLDEKDVKGWRCCSGCIATSSQSSAVTVLSYPQYCRYRAILKRLENVDKAWVRHSVVKLLGGLTFPTRNHRILFCRETIEKPDLEHHESFCNHLAPNLKGRPRKKRLKNSRGHSPSSESNTSEEARDMKETLRKKLTKIKIQTCKNGLKPRSQHDVLEEEEFLEKLFKFMRERNTPIERVPHLGFKQINLYLFYTYTQNLGGYDRVTGKKLWKQIYDGLGGSPGSTSAATCTRRHYERLLLPYERYVKGEEDKPLPPPVKHRRPSQAMPKSSSEKAIPSPPPPTLPTVKPLEEGKVPCPSNSPEHEVQAPLVKGTITPPPPPVVLPCTNVGSPLSSEANLCAELSSSPPLSTCTVHSLTPPPPVVDSKPIDTLAAAQSDSEPLMENEKSWTVQNNPPRKRSRDLSLSDTEKMGETNHSSTEEFNEMSSLVRSSSLSPPMESECMPHLSSYLVSTKETPSCDRISFPSAEESSTFPLPSTSPQSPPPLLPVQINKSSSPLSSLSTHSHDNPSPMHPPQSQSPVFDQLPSPPPLVDLTRVVNSLPIAKGDTKSLPISMPAKFLEADIQDLSSAKRFRSEDAENIHPNSPKQGVGYSHTFSLLPHGSEATNSLNTFSTAPSSSSSSSSSSSLSSTSLSSMSSKTVAVDSIHPYSLPFSYLSQSAAADKQKTPTSINKVAHGRTNHISGTNGVHSVHNNREIPPLISRPSVIQHTQKASQTCSPLCFQNESLRSDVHHVSVYDSPVAHRQTKSNNDAGQCLNVKKEVNGVTPSVTSPSGSVQYYYQQYYHQHQNARVPQSSPVISLSESYSDFSRKSHVEPSTLSSPQYYPAPKVFLQSQSYRDSYLNHYFMPCDSGNDEILDLSIKKTKPEKKDDEATTQTSLQEEVCIKLENNIEYERITPPEKELDLSMRPPKVETEKSSPSVPLPSVHCASGDVSHNNSLPFPKNDSSKGFVNSMEGENHQMAMSDKIKPPPGSPAESMLTNAAKNDDAKIRMNCHQTLCSSSSCFPCLGKQSYYTSHLPSSYYSSSVYGFHPQFLLSSSRYLQPDHVVQNNLTTSYKDVFHPSLFGGPYSYSLTSQLYPHLYKESQPYLYQPK